MSAAPSRVLFTPPSRSTRLLFQERVFHLQLAVAALEFPQPRPLGRYLRDEVIRVIWRSAITTGIIHIVADGKRPPVQLLAVHGKVVWLVCTTRRPIGIVAARLA